MFTLLLFNVFFENSYRKNVKYRENNISYNFFCNCIFFIDLFIQSCMKIIVYHSS